MIRIVYLLVALIAPLVLSAVEKTEPDPYAGLAELKKSLAVPRAFVSVHRFHPVTYLQMFRESDLKPFLDGKGKARDPVQLKTLFIEAHQACLKKYHQGYLISSRCPIVQLLAKSYPKISDLKGEPGDDLYMADIVE